jgi:hypothetical protein
VTKSSQKKKGRTTSGNQKGSAALWSKKKKIKVPGCENGPEKPKGKDGKG